MIFESKNDRLLMGNLRITRLSDGHVTWGPEQAVINAPQDEVEREMNRLEEGHERHHCLRITCLLVETGDQRILIDTGWGRWPFAQRHPDSEPVTAHLAQLGYSPDDIDLVVTSHAHPDHIGGNCVEVNGELRPRYRNARYRLHAADYEYYTAPERLEASNYHRHNLPPLAQAGILDLVDQEHEIVPGITMLPAPGHSPGNCVIVITAGNEMAVYLGDVAHHPLHLEHPEWNAVYDVLPEQSRATRGWLYERLVREQPWIIGCHFMSPGIGKLERKDDRYRWNELPAD